MHRKQTNHMSNRENFSVEVLQNISYSHGSCDIFPPVQYSHRFSGNQVVYVDVHMSVVCADVSCEAIVD